MDCRPTFPTTTTCSVTASSSTTPFTPGAGSKPENKPEKPESRTRRHRENPMEQVSSAEKIPSVPAHGMSFEEALRVWTRVALLSFGGPAGQIAVMHRILVDEKHWISESRFLHALHYCMLLPGPEAKQLAVYIGWLMHRTLGGIVAGSLFVLPGAIAIMALSYIYALYGNVPVVAALFFGLKAAVLTI